MSSTPLCPPVFVSGKSYPIPFPLGSLAGSCSCGWVIPVSPSQSNPGKNNSMSVNVEMDRESRRAARTDARGSSLLPQEPGASLGPALRPRSPVHGAGLQRTLWFFIISLSVIGFLLNLFAWFVLQCVSGNILHLCILITVKFEDKNLCCTVSCFQWGKQAEEAQLNEDVRDSLGNQISPLRALNEAPSRAEAQSPLKVGHGFQP